MALDEEIRGALSELGKALNEAVSSSEEVHAILERIRETGWGAYLVLDATVALERKGRRSSASLPSIRRGGLDQKRTPRRAGRGATEQDADAHGEAEAKPFQISVKDLSLLRALGIDPTRAVRRKRKASASVTLRSTVARRT